jgi:hypothetical protein
MCPTFPIPARESGQLDGGFETDPEIEEGWISHEPGPGEDLLDGGLAEPEWEDDIHEGASDYLFEPAPQLPLRQEWEGPDEWIPVARSDERDVDLLLAERAFEELGMEPPQSALAEYAGIGSEEKLEPGAGLPPGEQETIVDSFTDMVRRGLVSAAVLALVVAGERDERTLTNRIFFARHPEVGGRKLRPDETSLATEWLQIRDHIVRPLLASHQAGPTAPSGGRQRMSTQALRDAWTAYAGREDLMVPADVLGHRPQVNPRIVEAVRTLGQALSAAGYSADRVGGFSDRTIRGSVRRSLHAYGIAIDIDSTHNPHRRGQAGPARWSSAATQQDRRAEVAAGRADTSFTPEQIEAVRAIRTVDGLPVFFWGGGWRTSPDAMHFQIDVTPDELARGLAAPASTVQEQEFEEEYAPDGEREEFFPVEVIQSIFRKPTVGFEFDVHYGLIPGLLPVGVPMPPNKTLMSEHSKLVEGFEVQLDGQRLEINTKPLESTADGKKELREMAARIKTFAAELNSGCRSASEVRVAGISGAARPFLHPRMTMRIAKLPVRGGFDNCSVWAAPQATLTVRLSKIAKLVERIKASEGKGAGVALTGGSGSRMGLQSEAIYRAYREVKRARRASAFSADLEGFLILLASYLWTGELPYRFPTPDAPARPGEDYEPFGKAYLPVNVKTPLSQVFGSLLDAGDQKAFRDRFADGAARVNLFRLARPSGATLADGDRKFLPTGPMDGGMPSVHELQKAVFGVAPTWNDVVEHTLNSTHRGWGDRLLVPMSTPLDVSKTSPRVLLELRRVGFTAVDRSDWEGFMLRMHSLTDELDR